MAAVTVATAVITLDTSAVFALLNRRDTAHTLAAAALDADPGPYLVPAAILGEVAHLVEERLGARVLDAFLADLETGAFTLDCGLEDTPRARELAMRYADLPLGYVDAAVVACAERSGGRVLTLDQRDFGVVEAEGRIVVVPGSPVG